MTEPIDDHFVRRVAGWQADVADVASLLDPAGPRVEPELLLACFDAQVQSRNLDLAARWLQQRGEGFYTIGSSGHGGRPHAGSISDHVWGSSAKASSPGIRR